MGMGGGRLNDSSSKIEFEPRLENICTSAELRGSPFLNRLSGSRLSSQGWNPEKRLLDPGFRRQAGLGINTLGRIRVERFWQ